MAPRPVGPPRGILHRAPSEGRTAHRRWAPPEDLAPFVEHFWAVHWDLPEPFLQETLPHPSVHVVLENGQARVAGVVRGRFSRILEGQGRVFGIKFRPGGFYPFVGWPVSRIANRVVPLREVFGRGCTSLSSHPDDDRTSEGAAEFLRSRRPVRDPAAEETSRIVERIAAERAITRVEDLVSGLGWSTRRLQRQFSRYVGIGPKWVIQRYRLHEAVESIKAGAVVDWPQLALDLGYFDQAHFIRDFKALVGRPPAEYEKTVRIRS